MIWNLENLIILGLLAIVAMKSVVGHKYGKGFYNHKNCLYAYMNGSEFEMTTLDGDVISEDFTINDLEYDHNRTKCAALNEPGRLVFTFEVDEKKEESKIKSITMNMKIVQFVDYWGIEQASLTVFKADKKRTFPLRIDDDMYATLKHSYSCSELTLFTSLKKKASNETGRIEPRARITLKRFQLQPFEELDNAIFGPSFDCSTWISIPGLMGLILIFFMTIFTIIGVIFLQDINTNDFKYNKEGILFTQSQMEHNKQQ